MQIVAPHHRRIRVLNLGVFYFFGCSQESGYGIRLPKTRTDMIFKHAFLNGKAFGPSGSQEGCYYWLVRCYICTGSWKSCLVVGRETRVQNLSCAYLLSSAPPADAEYSFNPKHEGAPYKMLDENSFDQGEVCCKAVLD